MQGHTAWDLLVFLCLLVASVSVLLTAGLQWFVHRRSGGIQAQGRVKRPISVLKPIKGADSELEGNLRALLEQSYAHYEVVVGVADASDPAVDVTQRLMCQYPKAQLRLVTGAPELGANPKVNNLRHMVGFAKHSTILISDADVRPAPTYLSDIVTELEREDAALVHSPIVSREGRSVGSILEAAQMNLFVAGAVAGADALLDRQCVIGKSMLLRLDRFQRIGGWPAVADVLAEDYVVGSRLQAAGERVVLSRHFLHTCNPQRTVASFMNRHLRWAQMRRRLGPTAFYFEPLGVPYVWLGIVCLMLAIGAAPAVAKVALPVAAGLAVLKLTADHCLSMRLLGANASMLPALFAPAKDVLILAVWISACFRRRVYWRGTQMWIGEESVLTPIPEGASGRGEVLSRALRAFQARG